MSTRPVPAPLRHSRGAGTADNFGWTVCPRHWVRSPFPPDGPADRSTCVLFGDGAGAAIFQLSDLPLL
ncbi:MAG: hypothetical protein ACLTNY_03195 [Blautia massiliensis (ex Durand et al. 2017)]